jgi:hypothetical protein
MRTASGLEVPDGTPGAELGPKKEIQPVFKTDGPDDSKIVLPWTMVAGFSPEALRALSQVVALRLHALIETSKQRPKKKTRT